MPADNTMNNYDTPGKTTQKKEKTNPQKP